MLALTDRCGRNKCQVRGLGHLGQAFQGGISYRIFRSHLRTFSDFRFSRLNVMSMMSRGILWPHGIADGRTVGSTGNIDPS